MSGRASIWLKQGALIGASLLFSLLMIELMLRLLGWSHPLFAKPDPDLGWSFRSGVSGWSSHEDTVHLTMNRFGFRGSEWPEQPASGTIRIAMLGDSFLDSSNLADQHDLARLVEHETKSCPSIAGRRVEVLNFGVSGYGTAQQYLQLQNRVASFRPDLVVLAFYAGNDVMNNSLALSAESQKTKPYFVETPSGELRLDVSFRDSDAFRKEVRSDWVRRAVNSSYLLQALKQVVHGRPAIPSPVRFENGSTGKGRPDFLPTDPALFSPPADETWRAAWSVTEKLLLRMRDWSQQRKLGFGVVIIPDPVEALPSADWRSAVAREIKSDNLDYPVQRIAGFAAQNNLPHLSLLEPLRNYGERERVFVYGFPPMLGNGHLNPTGSEISGKEIAGWLCRRFLQGN